MLHQLEPKAAHFKPSKTQEGGKHSSKATTSEHQWNRQWRFATRMCHVSTCEVYLDQPLCNPSTQTQQSNPSLILVHTEKTFSSRHLTQGNVDWKHGQDASEVCLATNSIRTLKAGWAHLSTHHSVKGNHLYN